MRTLDDETIGTLMSVAYTRALRSPDPSTQNGAIIAVPPWMSPGRDAIIGTGCNTFPPGVKPRLERPAKYLFIEHAERMAISNVHQRSESRYMHESVMVCPWAACADCARAIVLSGIKTLIRHADPKVHGDWGDSINAGDIIMSEGGVTVINWDGQLHLPTGFTLLRDGKPLAP